MGYVIHKVSKPIRTERQATLAAKIAVAVGLCLVAHALLAQAPAGLGLREEVDPRGFKFLVPHADYVNPKIKSKLNDIRNKVRTMVATQPSGIENPATREQLNFFYLQILFPLMTTEDGLKTLSEERRIFLSQHVAAAKDPAMHTYLINTALSSMTKIVSDTAYLQPARYNAMYIISSLNDQEPNPIGATPTLPEPMRQALPVILQQFQKGSSDDVRIAALLGLSRHLEWENYKQPPSTPMQPANRAAIIKELTSLAEAKEAPEGRDAEVHTWMRRRAVEGLSMGCLTKPDAEIAATLERLLKDEGNVMSVRMAVATSLGRVSLQGAKVEAVPTAKELGYLALAACESELTRAEAQRKAEYEHMARLSGTYTGDGEYSGGGMMGAGGMPMPGGGGRMPGMMGEGGAGSLRGPLRPPAGGLGGEGALGGGVMPGGYGGEGGAIQDPTMQDPKHYQMEYLRRRIRQQLYAVQLGLLGTEDHAPPRTGAGEPKTPPPPPPPTSGEKKEPRGMFAIAKAGPEKDEVDKIYHRVRKLAEVVEGAGVPTEPSAMFLGFVKEMRKEMKPLELAVGKRLPPPVAAAGAPTDDAPTIGGPSGKAGPGKGAPGAKGGAPLPPNRPAVPGKSASRPPFRPQPNVFGQPRFGR